MPRWLALILIASLTACEKPTPAKHDLATLEKTQTQQEKKTKNHKGTVLDEAAQIAALIDPAKLTTLRERGANPRILKITAILQLSKNPQSNPAKKNPTSNPIQNQNPAEIVEAAVALIGWSGTEKGRLTAAAIIRNLAIVEELGATTPEDIIEMRKGQAPTVRRGPSTGDIVSVDHIIPVAAVPQLSNVIANLELMPLRANQSKGDSIGPRQRSLARQLHSAGLLKSPELPE